MEDAFDEFGWGWDFLGGEFAGLDDRWKIGGMRVVGKFLERGFGLQEEIGDFPGVLIDVVCEFAGCLEETAALGFFLDDIQVEFESGS